MTPEDRATQEATGQAIPAEFTQRSDQRPGDRPMYPTRVMECWCGWSTEAEDFSTFHGRTNSLALALLSHRIAHLEGRVKTKAPGHDR